MVGRRGGGWTPGGIRQALLFLAIGAAVVAVTAAEGSSCFADPAQPSCQDASKFYPESAVQDDIDSLCDLMPWMSSCSVQNKCVEGIVTGRFCSRWSILAGICSTKWGEDMSGMPGCKNYTALCAVNPKTTVEQCKYGIPHQVPTDVAIADVLKLCNAMPGMDQCKECTKKVMPGQNCPHPLETLSQLCLSMQMEDCVHWSKMCESHPEGLDYFCGTDDGQCSGIMQMYFHNGLQDYILFKWWVPCTPFNYLLSCIMTAMLSVLVSFIKAIRSQMDFRIRVRDYEKRKSAPPSRNVSRGATPRNAATTVAAAGEGLTEPLLERERSSGISETSVQMEESTSHCHPQPRRVSLSRSELDPPEYLLPSSREVLWGNVVRAVFLGVTMTLDYALMLIAMTFNYGLVASVVGGAMIGAVLFGHNGKLGPDMGERACCDNS